MLNPPLSHLSSELVGRIVEHVADTTEYSAAKRLKRLSVVDRAFTLYCQSHLFKELILRGTKSEMIKALENVSAILMRKESSSISFMRKLRLNLSQQEDLSWLFQDQSFVSLMEILSRASRLPYKLKIFDWDASTTKEPDLIVKGLSKSFFSSSLKSMLVWHSKIPANTLLICPTLRHLLLSSVQFLSPSKDDEAKLDHRELPRLRKLDVRLSFNAVRQMLPGEGVHQVADLSRLEVLLMCPEDEDNMTLVQPILDVAHETLQKIDLQHPYTNPGTDPEDEQRGHLLLAGLLNFQKLHHLRIFELRSGIYDDDDDRWDVVKDITSVLSTVPPSNSLVHIYLRVQVYGKAPFKRIFQVAKAQKWKALSEEIARISSGKPLRFVLDMDIQHEEGDPLDRRDPIPEGQVRQLYGHIEKEIKALRTVEGVELDFANEITRRIKQENETSDWDTDSELNSDY